MIDKIANNKTNQEAILRLNPPEKVREKLNYYRTLFGKTHDLSDTEFEKLKKDIAKFFNLKPFVAPEKIPERLVRISNNNRILESKGKELSYLTEISELLAPPIQYCDYGRCNIPKQQVLYCATNVASAYWETKPRKGDVISISHFELKPKAKVNCTIIRQGKKENPMIDNALQEIYYLLDDFFVDAFSLEVARDRPRDYIFSSLLSSEQLFYPIPSDKNIESIIYPSVKKKKYGQNFAIRNDLIFEKYNLIGVETKFILDEFDKINPETEELTTDELIGSFGTKTFDFETDKILYRDDAPKIFKEFRNLQMGGGRQVRFDNPQNLKTLTFDLSVKNLNFRQRSSDTDNKYGRNDKVTVIYQNGSNKENVKYKHVQGDIEKGICKITKY